jgi:polysaccharide export outer membrane protein
MKRCLSYVVVLAVISLGCASNKPAMEPRGDVYDRDQVSEFLRDTATPDSGNAYIIGIGDRLDVLFFVHQELSTINLLVRSDGCITLPYVGDVVAVGVTPMRLDSTLTTKFSEVLRDPNLSVIVREPADKLIYVLGQVKRPGAYPYETKMSLLQALALGAGFERGAKVSHVLVIRREGLQKIVGVEVDVAAMFAGHNLEQDFWLKNYDIVYVPKTRLQSAGEFMQILYDILYPPVDILLRGWTAQAIFLQIDYLQSRP